jgi:hypothetical protein
MIDIFMLIRRLPVKKLQFIINIALLLIVCFKLAVLFEHIKYNHLKFLDESIRFPWTRSTIYRNG